MSKSQEPIDYSHLISKYLSGNANDGEVRQLEQWVLADPENKAQFVSDKKAWMLAGLEKAQTELDVGQEWAQLSQQLFAEGRVKTLPIKGRISGIKWIGIAASVVFLIAVAGWLVNSFDSADLRLVAENEVVNHQLPDGTNVSLNRFSSITFKRRTRDGHREVRLQGDAFFEVVRDTMHPFSIKTSQVEIEVLGTSFYVDVREGIPTAQIIVKTGLVAVKKGDQHITLSAGEVGIYDKKEEVLTKRMNEDPNYLGWQTNALTFSNTDLKDVVFALNRHFQANISISNPVLRTCQITATFNDKSLEAILRIIEKTLNIEVEREGDEIRLKGTKCQ